MRIASSLLGDGAECIHSKLGDDAKQVGVTDTPKGNTANLSDLDRLEKWADRNLLKFNRNCRVLQLGQTTPGTITCWGLSCWKATLQKRTWWYWWTPSWSCTSNLPLQKRRHILGSRLREVIFPLYPLIMPYWKYCVQIWAPWDKRNRYTLIWNSCLHACIFHLKREQKFDVYLLATWT